MLTKLALKNFKNFRDVTLPLGPFTLLIGANASGKTNIRDAFRFLHGISRGYNLAEIMGEKYGEGGALQWRGIRGGPREAVFPNADTFSMTCEADYFGLFSPQIPIFPLYPRLKYFIEINPGGKGKYPPVVVRESLYLDDQMIYDSHPSEKPPDQSDPQHITVRIPPGGKHRKGHTESFIAFQPVLTQIADRIREKRDMDRMGLEAIYSISETVDIMRFMRFLDLSPDAMREPSFPGQIDLGDRGENLSPVLQAICENPAKKKALVEWVRELTPMDASDFQFPQDQIGKILVALTEETGRTTTAYSASDGTLRFLGTIAALLGPKPSKFYFFEELDTGLHPSRLHLLMELVEKRAYRDGIQMIATTHSPQLLLALGEKAVNDACLVYRLPETPEAKVRRIVEIPTIREILEQQDLARLHESGWFEDAMFFMEETEDAM